MDVFHNQRRLLFGAVRLKQPFQKLLIGAVVHGLAIEQFRLGGVFGCGQKKRPLRLSKG